MHASARRLRRGGLLLVLLLALSGGAMAGVPWRIDSAALTPGEREAADALIARAWTRLPDRMRAALARPIGIGWSQRLPEHVQGRAYDDRLRLDRALLAAGREDEAEAALLHELAHVYDRGHAGGLSRDPRLLDLAGWGRRPFRLGLRMRESGMSQRRPDAYESRNPREFVAVNLEHYLRDPDYACRRPDLAAYFAGRVGDVAHRAGCDAALPLLQASEAGADVAGLDPARVYAIDYLFAEANDAPMSRWGHAMLRLVVCAPGRAPGPDCRLDLSEHRVLSFRAFVGDVQISNWRGLTGSYPSRLFVLPLSQVVDDYTKVQLRGLRSLPLRLSREEIAALVTRAAGVQWGYDGEYWFLGNNCAVETWRLLQDGVPRLASLPLQSVAPNALMRRLVRTGVADAGVLADPAEALRMGYRFDAADAQYQAMYEVAQAALGLPQRDAQAWLDASPRERTPWLAQADLRSSAALLLLEQAAYRRAEQQARDVLKRRFLGDGAGLDDAAANQALAALMRGEQALALPAVLAEGKGYGLPQGEERRIAAVNAQRSAIQRSRADRELRDRARSWLPHGLAMTLEGGEANLALIGQRLRSLQ